MNTFRNTLLAKFGLLLATSALVASPQHEESVNAVIKERLSAVVNAGSKSGFTGIVLAELRGQVIANIAVGRRGDAGDNPNTTETLFEIASVTKPLTAIALTVLAEQGKLSLDDPIQKHLPNVPEDCSAITIRHLLQHTSGIPGSNLGPPRKELTETVKIFLKGGPQSKPGTKFEYWNQGYALLSAIIESTSKTEYTEAMRNLLFEPAGMTQSCFTGDSPNVRDDVAIGQSTSGLPRSALEPPYGNTYGMQYRGMGGAICNVGDLHRLIQSLRGVKLLNEESKKAMLQPGLGNFGGGWFVETIGESQRRVFHSGSVRGFLSSVTWYPDDESSLIILSNSDNRKPFFTVESACRQLLETEFVVPPKAQVFPREFTESIAGQYVLGPRTVNLTAEGATIKILLDWGGPKTGGVLEKRDGDKLYFATVTNESLELTPGPIEDGRVSSIRMLNGEYRRKK